MFGKSARDEIGEPRTRPAERLPVRPLGWPVAPEAKMVRFDPALRTAAEAYAELRRQATDGDGLE